MAAAKDGKLQVGVRVQPTTTLRLKSVVLAPQQPIIPPPKLAGGLEEALVVEDAATLNPTNESPMQVQSSKIHHLVHELF
jgi:hypothetical protein